MTSTILRHPDEKLRQRSKDVTSFDETLQLIANQLVDTMYTHDGVGIAAPQIGIDRRIVVVDPSSGDDAKMMTVMINPVIVKMSGEQVSEEGCLSIQGVKGKVRRADEVVVEYLDIKGNSQQLQAKGFHAAVVQHEVDHLNGVLFVDRAFELTAKGQFRKSA